MRTRSRGFFQVFAVVLVLIMLVAIGMTAGILAGYLKNAPSVDDVDVEARKSLPTVVYDINGNVLTRLAAENRVWTPLSEMPQYLKDAVIAVEDHTFYEHHGINVKRIIGALVQDLKLRSKAQGGSTITAQLARNVFLSREKTLSRKIWELLYAFQLERRYTKDEILEYYLNWINYGHGAYGVGAAAQYYFGKPVSQLTLGEAALIAGIPKGPEIYSPRKNLDASLRRRAVVLQRMVDEGKITKEQAEAAKAEEPKLVEPKQDQVGKYANFMIRDYLIGRYGADTVYRGGLSVKTTIDIDAQRAAEKAIADLLPAGRVEERQSGKMTYPQAALVALDAATGEIRAIVGGRGEDEYNRAIRAERSPGSSIKPFVYTAAIDSGYTPSSVVVDEPLSYPMGDGTNWEPKNYNKTFQGPMTLRHALEQSTNMVAIKLAQSVGPKKVIDYAKRMGITSLVESGERNDAGLALALGGLTRGITPIEMAEAYSALANGGIKVRPYYIVEVRDAEGTVVESNGPDRKVVLDEKTAYIVTDMMKGVISSPSGTGRRADIGRPAAGKTGTADSNTDAWFVGFTPDMVAAVWIGEDTTKQMTYPKIGTIGSGKAAEIWARFMKQALARVPARDFEMPDGIVTGVRICEASGKLASPYCPSSKVVSEKFIAGTEPTSECPIHGQRSLWSPPATPQELQPTPPALPEAEEAAPMVSAPEPPNAVEVQVSSPGAAPEQQAEPKL